MNHPTLQRALHDAQSGKLDAAIASVRTLLRVQPKNTDAMQMLGLFLSQQGQTQQAVAQLERAVAIAPNVAGYRNNLGNALAGLERHNDARAQFEKAIAIDPGYARAYLGLALARTALLDSLGAVDACRRGLAIRAEWPEMISCAATAFEAADQIDEAIRVVREGVRQIPASESLRSKLAFLLNYSAIPRDELFRTHTDYRDHVVRAHASAPKPESDPDRPLRIGLLSGDLRTHSVAFFADAIVHTKPARDTFTIFATLPTTAADPLTQRFRARADAWIESSILDDDGLDRAIRDARIDVLIDLSGHTHGGGSLHLIGSQPR